jgi:hypothetical protein
MIVGKRTSPELTRARAVLGHATAALASMEDSTDPDAEGIGQALHDTIQLLLPYRRAGREPADPGASPIGIRFCRTCDRPIRPAGVKAADAPGTMQWGARGECNRCARATREGQGGRAARDRQLEIALASMDKMDADSQRSNGHDA